MSGGVQSVFDRISGGASQKGGTLLEGGYPLGVLFLAHGVPGSSTILLPDQPTLLYADADVHAT